MSEGGRLAIGIRLVAVASLLTLTGCSASAPTPSPPQSTTAVSAPAASTPTATAIDVSADLELLENEYAARVGVSVLDLATGATIDHRADERFGYASTVKAFAAAEFLRRTPPADRGRVVTWAQADVDEAGYSPATQESIADGLTLQALAEAAVRQSDNTALNLVLDSIGGVAALGEGFAQLGDTTTPEAFTRDLAALLESDHLAPDDLALLLDWMGGNATGDGLIRAGAPLGWVVADKSGGAGGIRNDIAVVTRPDGGLVVVSILTATTDPEAAYNDELVRRAAAVVLQALSTDSGPEG